MTPAEILALLDAVLTMADRLSDKVAEMRAAGQITIAEQEDRRAQVDAIRRKVLGSA